jgi:hypothetical protein
VDELELSSPLTYFIKRHIHSRAEDNYIYVSLVIQEIKNARSSGMYKHSEIRALLESFPFGLTEMLVISSPGCETFTDFVYQHLGSSISRSAYSVPRQKASSTQRRSFAV